MNNSPLPFFDHNFYQSLPTMAFETKVIIVYPHDVDQHNPHEPSDLDRETLCDYLGRGPLRTDCYYLKVPKTISQCETFDIALTGLNGF